MKFSFEINLSDSDYFDFNKFIIYHKRKQLINLSRLIVAIMYFVFALFFALWLKDGPILILAEVIWLLAAVLLFVFTKQHHLLSVKKQIKSFKKKGKQLYSPVSYMEFYDDFFCETTENEKNELKYEAIESVSIIKGKIIYLHKNDAINFLIPVICFETNEQYAAFISFIKTKCPKIDFYDKV